MFYNIYLKLLTSVTIINFILVFLLVFVKRRNPRTTNLWIMALAFLPLIGFILYIFMGQDFNRKKMFKLKLEDNTRMSREKLLQKKDILRNNFNFINSNSKNYSDIILFNLHSTEGVYSQDNDIDIFFNGNNKFESLLNDIREAKHSIDLEYYIFKPDKLGNKIILELEKKVEAGVRVRILIDGIGGRFIDRSTFKKFRELGGEVAYFFPNIFEIINIKINYRNHRKIVIIDDEIGYIGGINIGDEYLGNNKKFGYWRDTHVRITGSSVSALKLRFMQDWYYASKKKHDNKGIIKKPDIEKKGNIGVQIITSGPDTEVDNIKLAIIKMINSAKKYIYIQSPYFIVDETVKDALITAIYSGVKVYIMIPNKPDHPFVYWATLSNLGEMLEKGAKGYIYVKGFLHAKTIIIDNYLSTLGSLNMDMRSFSLNFETNAFIYDEKINAKLRKQFIIDIINSKEITWEDYLNRSNLVKIKESYSRLLSPIL